MKYSLVDLGLVDAPPDSAFDNLTKLAASLFKTPVSLVSIVDFENNRQFFKSQQGLLVEPWATQRQTPLSHSFCQHVVNDNATLVVENAALHAKVKDNLAIRDLGVAAYLGAPIYNPQNEPIGAFCVIDGETHRWTHDEIEQLERLSNCVTDVIRLKAAHLDSEALRMDQVEFTYAISHDLKAPINTLRLLINELSIISTAGDAQEHGMFIERSLQTISRMGTLIKDVLDYTRVGATDNTGVENVSLERIIREIVDDLAGDLSQCGGTVAIGDLPVLKANPMHLRILFQNLICNALKFRRKDIPPLVSISAEQDSTGQDHKIVVGDNGIGIAPEHQAKIFNVFARLHNETEYAGTGLGLALCHRIASNYEGTIEVDSIEGSGTKFSVVLPGERA